MKISENYFRRQNQKFEKMRKTVFCIRPRNLQSKFEPNRSINEACNHFLRSLPSSLYIHLLTWGQNLKIELLPTMSDLFEPEPLFLNLNAFASVAVSFRAPRGLLLPKTPPSPPSLSRRVPVYLLSFFLFFFIPFSFLCLLNLIFIFCLTFVLFSIYFNNSFFSISFLNFLFFLLFFIYFSFLGGFSF